MSLIVTSSRFERTDCFGDGGLHSIEDGSVRLLIADLPYGQTSNSWDVPLDLVTFWKEARRILVENGTVALFAKGGFVMDLITSNKQSFRYEWIWNKKKGANFAHVRYRPLYTHEYILIFYDGVGVYNPQMRTGKKYRQVRAKDECIGIADSMNRGPVTISHGERYPSTILEIQDVAQRNKVHPAQKPIDLYAYFINTYTNEGELVCDPVAGSGTAAIACLRTGRNYVCFEREKGFYNVAMKSIGKCKVPTKIGRGLVLEDYVDP